jgi:hypothetical protein
MIVFHSAAIAAHVLMIVVWGSILVGLLCGGELSPAQQTAATFICVLFFIKMAVFHLSHASRSDQ